jgi:hypothetical protein
VTIDDWLAGAEVLLSTEWGAPVTCTVAQPLREQGRSRVYRLAVGGGPVASVILKACVADGRGRPYVVADQAPGGAFAALCKEWAAASLLGPLALGPGAYGLDTALGFCLLEDFGDGETLADRLTGGDPDAAASALVAYARSLGDMHTATGGANGRWNSLLAEQGARAGGSGPYHTPPWRLAADAAPKMLSDIGVAVPDGLEGDLARIAEALDNPRAYLAFTPTDCCPDNHFLRGERVVFFDCEGATMRHALLDAAYFLAPFPTCWCCGALPDGMPERLLTAYRERFPGGADFDDQLTLMLAAWLVQGLSAWGDVTAMRADAPWGLSTLRQRTLALVANLIARPNVAALLPSLVEVAAGLDRTCRAAWSDFTPMLPYPAFRSGGAPSA